MHNKQKVRFLYDLTKRIFFPHTGRENKIQTGRIHEGMYVSHPGRCHHCPPDHRELRSDQTDLLPELHGQFDLINWYFDKLLIKSFEYMGQGKTVQEGLQLKFSYIGEEKEFFRAAFRYDRQNSLREHDFQLIFRFYQDLIQLKTGAPASDDIRFLLEMYCHGSISMTIEWVLSGMAASPEDLARLMVEAMPAKLADLFASFGILTE